MARFSSTGGSGSGAPGPQGPQGPAGEDAVLPQDLGTTDNPAFNTITLTSNGATNNITIGDDVILGDGNVANHIVIIGQQDDTAGGIVLGTNETEFISTNGTDLSVNANNDIILNPGSTYAYLGTPEIDGSNRIATMGDITGGSGSNTADFVFTNDENDTGRSIISLPGDKGMTIAAGVDSDLYLTAGDDLYIQTLGTGDDIFIQAADDIRFTAGNENIEVRNWIMNSEGEFHLPGDGYISNPLGSSGDGYGNDTLHLVPDESLGADQHIVIDPTSPNHIHIRAGGTQDDSTADLFLGGERTHVKLSDADGNVRISSKRGDQGNSYENMNTEASNLLIINGEITFNNNYYVQVDGIKHSPNGNYIQNGQTFITVYDIIFQPGQYYYVAEVMGENGWNFSSNGTLYGPAQGYIPVSGLTNDPDFDFTVTSNRAITLSADNGEFLNDPTVPSNQIATIGDVANYAPVETSFTVNGGSLGDMPTFDGAPLFSGTYVKIGPQVHFQIQVDMDNITSFGTGQYYVDLPFDAKYGYQFKEGCLHDISSSKQYAVGGHVYSGTGRLFLTFTNSAGQDEAFDFNSPVTLSVADNFHIAGTYISQ